MRYFIKALLLCVASLVYADTLIINKFPAEIGNYWKYTRNFYVVVYDTVNNDTTEYLTIDTLYEDFKSVDTIANWECYKLHHILFEQGGTFPETWWHSHPDSALLWIAYTDTIVV